MSIQRTQKGSANGIADSTAPASSEVVRAALRMHESEQAAGAPPFSAIAAHIAHHPSELETPAWSAVASARLALALAASQIRIMPHAVLPAACIIAMLAVAAANLAGTALAWVDGTWLFSMILLAGGALTATLALSAERADAVSLATPIGPQTVTLARLAAVLCFDLVAGGAACIVSALLGIPLDPSMLVAAWLVPLAAVSGVAAFVAVWTGSAWAGTIIGAACIPLVSPVAHAVSDSGAGALIAAVQEMLGPAGIVLFGIMLLAAAICSARRATVARMQAA